MWNVDRYVKITCGILAMAANLLITACSKGESPILSELIIDGVTHEAIHCHVDISEGKVDDHAFFYATTKMDVEKSSANKEKGTHSATNLEATISGLNPNTTYYLRAYAINNHGRTYTATISTRTLPRVPTLEDNDYPIIDK